MSDADARVSIGGSDIVLGGVDDLDGDGNSDFLFGDANHTSDLHYQGGAFIILGGF